MARVLELPTVTAAYTPLLNLRVVSAPSTRKRRTVINMLLDQDRPKLKTSVGVIGRAEHELAVEY